MWEPAYFEHKKDPDNGIERWMLSKDYWKLRETKEGWD